MFCFWQYGLLNAFRALYKTLQLHPLLAPIRILVERKPFQKDVKIRLIEANLV
jgi:hypothetical protein